MPITIVGNYNQPRRGKANFISRETFDQATATTRRNLSRTTDQTTLGMGTATGRTLNQYRMLGTFAPGTPEGSVKEIYATATGEAYLSYPLSTATGDWVFTAADDYMLFKYTGGKWRVLVNSGATTATDLTP